MKMRQWGGLLCWFLIRSSFCGRTPGVSITIPLLDGPIPEIPLDIGESVEFADLNCTVSGQYNRLIVDVYDADPDKVIGRVLYQFGEVPDNRLAGSHQFTGLHYIHHPKSEAELQFWAVVAP